MGEIADMMLDGTMCQGCGEWLHEGHDGPGYPGYCSSCKPSGRQDHPASPAKKKPRKPKKDCWAREVSWINDFAAIHKLTVELRNPLHPEYQIARIKAEGVSLIVYPHTTKGTGNQHARIRNEGSSDKNRARVLMLASGFSVKMGGLPEGKNDDQKNGE